MQRRAACALSGLCAVLIASGVRAQEDPRDAQIQELQKRIESLERRLEQQAQPPAQQPTPQPAAPPRPPTPAQKQAATPATGPAEEETARALERTLVREGGLVLPRGLYELEPRLRYSYQGKEGLGVTSITGTAQVAQEVTRRDTWEASLGFRMGLPYASQFEMRIPYVLTRDERATAAMFTETSRASGRGDIELGVSKQITRERGARPSVLGNLTWKTRTGAFQLDRVSPGSGFQSLQATVTAVKRQDPLVFFGNLSYTATFARTLEERRIDPGNGLGFKIGTLLAASPQTSLRTAFEASRVGRTVIEGAGTPGSGATVGFLELGAASLLTPKSLLDFQLSIGVTPDSPRFRLDVSLPVRFQ